MICMYFGPMNTHKETRLAESIRPQGFHLKQGIETAGGCAPPAERCTALPPVNRNQALLSVLSSFFVHRVALTHSVGSSIHLCK